MRKGIVRVLCGILAAQSVLSHGTYSVNAEEITEQTYYAATEDNSTDNGEAETVAEELPEGGEVSEPSAVGSTLAVRLTHASGPDREQSFRIYLEGTSYEQELKLDSAAEDTVSFENLEDREYTLKIEASGFASYEQNIETDGYHYSVHVSTGERTEAGTGYMPYGDLNEDGVVDKADAVFMTDVLEGNKADLVYDLNGDGSVDLADLDKAVKLFYDMSCSAEQAKIVKTVNVESVTGNVPEFTKQEGSFEQLLNGSGSVSLSPAEEGAVISAENPVGLSFDFMSGDKPVDLEGFVVQTPAENRIETGQIEVAYMENGVEKTGIVVIGMSRERSGENVIGTAEVSKNGQMTIRLNGQIAVKKVTIIITSMTQKDASLAEITSVEFINNMEDHIPAPELDIPAVTNVQAGNKTILVSWEKVTNVTGYQVLVTLDGYTEYVETTDTTAEIKMFRNKSLENKKTYTIAVQSVNGDWKSGYEQTYTATPRYDTVPDAPDSLNLTSGYRTIHASWIPPKDNSADSYTLYYKKTGEDTFQKISDITAASYTLSDLEDEAEYTVYVTAVNEHGEGPASLQASAQTKTMKPVTFSQYRIINAAEGEGELTKHIKSVTRRANVPVYNSPLDEGNSTSALAVADNSFESYYQINDWDDAVAYHTGNEGWGLTVELDQSYKMDRFAVAAPDDSMQYTNAAVYYWEEGIKKTAQGLKLQRKNDQNGRAYYEITLSEPIETDKIQFGLQVSAYGTRKIQVAEIRLYEYDSLADDIRDLYTDDLYLAVRSGVTEADFEELQERIDATINGDYHPDRAALQAELDAAKTLYEEQRSFDDILTVHTQIGASFDSALKVSGLNAWQPLGVSAQAGEDVVIYVGTENGKQGNASKLQLVITQQHGEYNQFVKTVKLNVGRNVVTIPELVTTDVEKGGALYVQYTGNQESERYAVRVNGGTKIPVLNLYGVTDEEERQRKIQAYVEELESYCEELENRHDADHGRKILFFSFDTYDEKTCVYNMTDIMLDHMMISVPATQILAGLGGKDGADKLKNTVDAMDEMMELFYQHKGLAEQFEEGTDASVIQKNHIPSQHLNIRYMKMFSGAFMYAGGNHIGIEWESVKELIPDRKPVISEAGRLEEGSYFGWGIAHEIGHQINQGDYAVAEVTNNYFAVLAQADGTNGSVRFSYDDVYDKVTSNTVGYSSDVFTQLGMYWQLHLAYDNAYAQKTYTDYQEIYDSLLFARVDTYARDTSRFNNAEREVELTLTGDKDQNLMRLVSAAAEKNLTDFFVRWGFEPDEETGRFMSQFEEETRALYYINDDAKTEVLENKAENLENQTVVASVDVEVEHSDVTLNIRADERYADQVLGYEIVRVSTKKGNVEKEVVGFTTENTFTDSVTLGSRAVSYEVCPVDQMTNRTAAAVTETVKVVSDGNYDKSMFTVSTNMTSDMDQKGSASEQDPCEPEAMPAVSMVLDQDKTKEYIGKSETDPYLIIDLKQTLEVSALRYYAKSNLISDYLIEVSTDGGEYVTVSEGCFDPENLQQTVYFTNGTDPWVVTWDVRYIKITALGQAGNDIGVTELDILGPSGDNVEFTDNDGKVTIGRLAEDFLYGQDESQTIPAGSVVFAGSYKGNPAYNVVMLYDQNGSVVGGVNEDGSLTASQIILAPDPGNALLGEVSEGTWIYWIEPGNEFVQPEQVKAELYRVDNAVTNEGERLTSDTVFVDVPKQLEEVEIEK